MADALSEREHNVTFANLNDKYVFMCGGTFRKKGTTDYYNVEHNTWTLGPYMTAPRYDFSTCVLAGILYAFNGATPNYDSIESLEAQKLVNGQEV